MGLNTERLRISKAIVATLFSMGVAIFGAAAYSGYQLNQGDSIEISPQNWAWFADLKFKFVAGAEPYGPFVSESTEVAPVVAATLRQRPQRKARLTSTHLAARRLPPPVFEAQTPALASPELRRDAEATKYPELRRDAETTKYNDERSTLQDVRALLHKHLLLALTTQPEMLETIAQNFAPKLAPAVSTRARRHEKPAEERVIAFEAPVNTHFKGHEAIPQPASIQEAKDLKDLKDAQDIDDVDAPTDRIELSQAAPLISPPLTVPAIKITESAEYRRQPVKAESSPLPSAGVILVQAPPTPPREKPAQKPAAQVKAPAVSPPPPVVPAAPASEYPTLATRSVNSQGVSTFIEAFDSKTVVSGAVQERFTQEGESSWTMTRAEEHWPTLSRATSKAFPLVSSNTARTLSVLAGSEIQNETGIVFGVVPSGWSVRLSGRAEKPVFFNSENQSISPGAIQGERSFAFINAAPGAQLLSITNGVGAEEGAVGIAVLPNTATYVDFSALHRVSLTGVVLGDEARAVNGVTVRVLGSANARAVVDAQGAFNIPSVLSLPGYPTYIETDVVGEYTHRYQAMPRANLRLYRLSNETISGLLGQLEGAVSPESGLILAAVSGLAQTEPGLSPSVRPLSPSPSLQPEVYTVSATGQMLSAYQSPISPDIARFVSVQVPEGPNVVSLTNREDKVVWSEMAMISPAVINMIGPY